MKLKVGDKIRLLNEHGEGKITKVVSDQEVWVAIDGFDYPYPIYELLKVETDNSVLYRPKNETPLESNEPKSKLEHKFNFIPKKGALSKLFKKINPRGIPEIDLHIENLTDDFKFHVNSREALLFQLEYVKYIIQEAEQNTVREIILIHGKGEGILKTEVRKLLDSMAHVEYWDGAFQFYSTGATHLKIYY